MSASGDRVERVPFGGRLILRIPFRLSKPGAIQLAVGYLPMPASVLFSGGVEF